MEENAALLYDFKTLIYNIIIVLSSNIE